MSPEADFVAGPGLPTGAQDQEDDLGLSSVVAVMGDGDQVRARAARAALSNPVADHATLLWRQQALADLTANAGLATELYQAATYALREHDRLTIWGMGRSPESMRYTSVQVLETFVPELVKLRRLLAGYGDRLASPALRGLHDRVQAELDDRYLDEVRSHLARMQLAGGTSFSASLGDANHGTAYMMHEPPSQGMRWRLARRGPQSRTFSVAEGDEEGMRALARLQGRGIAVAATALAAAAAHVRGFFEVLQAETAFYLGAMHLSAVIGSRGYPTCTPLFSQGTDRALEATALCDAGLCLRSPSAVVANDLSTQGRRLVVVTGANRGGKSTFLRSVGVAQLMAQCGLPVVARAYRAPVFDRVLTHFKRDEDAGANAGRLESELERLSGTLHQLSTSSLLLCNEPFASTNEEEGSQIGLQVLVPLSALGTQVFVVTHLFELADGARRDHGATTLFLRARREGQQAPFRLVEAPPEPTAYGEDLYRRVFGAPPAVPLPGAAPTTGTGGTGDAGP